MLTNYRTQKKNNFLEIILTENWNKEYIIPGYYISSGIGRDKAWQPGFEISEIKSLEKCKYQDWKNDPKSVLMNSISKSGLTKIYESVPEKITSCSYDIETGNQDFKNRDFENVPVYTVSITDDDLSTTVYGYKELTPDSAFLERIYRERNTDPSKFRYVKLEDEEELLETAMKVLNSYNIIGGYNNLGSRTTKGFDHECLAKRYKKLTGKKFIIRSTEIDVLEHFADRVLRKTEDNAKLDTAAKHFLGYGKLEHDYKGDFNRFYEEDFTTLVYYNSIDSLVTQKLLQMSAFKHFLTSMCKYTWTDTQSIARNSQSGITTGLIFKNLYKKDPTVYYEKFESDWPYRKEGKTEGNHYYGGFWFTPKPGAYRWVTCNDFASLYPNSIRSYNLSPETITGVRHISNENARFIINNPLSEYKLDDQDYYDTTKRTARLKHLQKDVIYGTYEIIDNDATQFLVKTTDSVRGLYAAIMDELYARRKDVKREMKLTEREEDVLRLNSEQLAIKKVMNSFYGNAASNYTPFPNIWVGATITEIGRTSIKRCANLLENSAERIFKEMSLPLKKGKVPSITVIYGATDSCYSTWQAFVDAIDKELTDEETVDILLKANEIFYTYCTDMFNDIFGKYCTLDFELETVEKYFVIGEKKNDYYYRCIWDNKLCDKEVLKGSIGGSTIFQSRKELQKKALQIACEEGVSAAKEYFLSAVKELPFSEILNKCAPKNNGSSGLEENMQYLMNKFNCGEQPTFCKVRFHKKTKTGKEQKKTVVFPVPLIGEEISEEAIEFWKADKNLSSVDLDATIEEAISTFIEKFLNTEMVSKPKSFELKIGHRDTVRGRKYSRVSDYVSIIRDYLSQHGHNANIFTLTEEELAEQRIYHSSCWPMNLPHYTYECVKKILENKFKGEAVDYIINNFFNK